MSRTIKYTIAILFVLFFVTVVALSVTNEPARAEDDFEIKQIGTVVYDAKNYIGTSKTFVNYDVTGGYRNELFESLQFKLEGKVIEVDPISVSFSKLMSIQYPGDYTDYVNVFYDGNWYENTPIRFTIGKRKLIVQALIDGETSATVQEGENYVTSISYEGFVGYDDASSLEAPALILTEPKMPTTGYRIVPELAKSSNYEFEYRAATIVIEANPDFNKKYTENDVDVLILSGQFSPYYTMEYKDVGISATSVDYTKIKDKLDKYYGNGSLFDKYRVSACFTTNLYLDGSVVDLTDPIMISLLLPSNLRGKGTYMLVHFAPGEEVPDLLTGTEKNGYLNFSSVQLGEYVILTPVEGVNINLIIGIVIGIIAVIAIGVIFGAVFRKKY